MTGNQSSKLLKMTEKTVFLRITGEPVIIGEKEKNPAFQSIIIAICLCYADRYQ